MLTKKQLEDAAGCKTHACTSLNYECGMHKIRHYGATCTWQVAKTALALADMLKRFEWMHTDNTYAVYCPMCGWEKECGHKPDCELAALLKKVRGWDG